MLPAGRVQDPLPNGFNESGFFREGNKVRRRNHAKFGMLPTNQGFDPNDVPLPDIDLRLILEDEF